GRPGHGPGGTRWTRLRGLAGQALSRASAHRREPGHVHRRSRAGHLAWPARGRPRRGASPMSAVLELRDVSKTYLASTPVIALAHVDLIVETGETVAITGPSGSGKSTLLTMLGTLERPTAGTIVVAGQDASRLSDASLCGLRAWRIGFVFQQFHLLQHL